MSKIDEVNKAIKEMHIDQGLEQKPNEIGTVYGVCLTHLCPNHGKVGYYTGGFCKKCSTRPLEDAKKYVNKGIDIKGHIIVVPNSEINWITKVPVHDLSDRLSEAERKAFYGDPAEFDQAMSRLEHREQLDSWDDINE